MLYLIILLCVIIGFLGFKLARKQQLDTKELQNYTNQLQALKEEINSNQNEYNQQLVKLQVDCNNALQKRTREEELYNAAKANLILAQNDYNNLVNVKTQELNQMLDNEREKRQAELDAQFQDKETLYEKTLQSVLNKYKQQEKEAEDATAAYIQECEETINEYKNAVQHEADRFHSLRQPLLKYEMDKQANLFYTIQLPEEYHEDIEFLLTTVAAKVQHPDIISKLVWAEYVKPYLDATFKRINIEPKSGIYKLTNIDSGKSYIGKSTDVKKRISDHFKSAIGIKSIADQAVHHEILKTGFWNWMIEVIIYCDKDELSELEKYYIDFFKTQEFGYNRNSGG